MKRSALVFLSFSVIFAFSCASGPRQSNTGTNRGAGNSLDAALSRAAEEINDALPQGKRLATMSFDSEAPELSSYIMEELTGRLVKGGKLIMVDRQNIEYIQKELAFQESGAVSDETAKQVGNILGAESIATGSLNKLGASYRLRLAVVEVESSVNEAAVMLDVPGGSGYNALLTALKDGSSSADTSYRDAELARIPKTGADYLNRGLTFAIRGDFDTALEDLNDAVKLDPDMAMAYLQRGKVYFARQTEINSISNNFEFSYIQNQRNKTTTDDLAINDFGHAIEIDPNLSVAWYYRGILHSAIGEFNSAISDLTQCIRFQKDDGEGYNGRGMAYFAMGDYDRAIADFTQAIKIYPIDNAYSNRGYSYQKKGDYERAIADYTQAIELNPNIADHFRNRGTAYNILGDHDRAIADFTQAIKINPDISEAYLWRGNLFNRKGNYDQAIADLTQSIRIDSILAFIAYYERGVSYQKKNDHDRAITDFTHAIEFDPDYGDAYSERGYSYQVKGNYDLAIADYTQAIRINPNNPFLYNSRGLLYFSNEDYDSAIADFTAALRLDASNVILQNNLKAAQDAKAAAGR